MGGAEIRVSDPVVSFRETISDKSDHVVMSKSPNKHNRFASCMYPHAQRVSVLFNYGQVSFSQIYIMKRPPQLMKQESQEDD